VGVTGTTESNWRKSTARRPEGLRYTMVLKQQLSLMSAGRYEARACSLALVLASTPWGEEGKKTDGGGGRGLEEREAERRRDRKTGERQTEERGGDVRAGGRQKHETTWKRCSLLVGRHQRV
jgi:hypothetical protein